MRLPAALVLVCGLLTSGCGEASGDSILDKDTLTVGVRPDLPGLGFKRPDGTFEGFDIDVAEYVAGRLGRKVTFVPTLAADRIRVLTSNRADLVLATLSVTPARKTEISFAGPYYNSYQDIMVRAEDTGVKEVRDLKGRRFCAVDGADPTKRLLALEGMSARLVPAKGYNECMTMMRARTIDAITTNDVILAGLIGREGKSTRLVNTKISEQNTGIGIRHGDVEGCEALNRAITQMYQDGTAVKLAAKWFAGTGLDQSIVEVPQFEGCE